MREKKEIEITREDAREILFFMNIFYSGHFLSKSGRRFRVVSIKTDVGIDRLYRNNNRLGAEIRFEPKSVLRQGGGLKFRLPRVTVLRGAVAQRSGGEGRGGEEKDDEGGNTLKKYPRYRRGPTARPLKKKKKHRSTTTGAARCGAPTTSPAGAGLVFESAAPITQGEASSLESPPVGFKVGRRARAGRRARCARCRRHETDARST